MKEQKSRPSSKKIHASQAEISFFAKRTELGICSIWNSFVLSVESETKCSMSVASACLCCNQKSNEIGEWKGRK